MKQKSFYSSIMAGALLVALPGCFFNSDKKQPSNEPTKASSGEPLICFQKKSVLDSKEFAEKLDLLYQTNAGVKGVIESMPPEEQHKIYKQFAEGCATEKLITRFVDEKGLSKTQEYKAMRDQAHDAVDSQLRMQAFQNELVKEAEALVAKVTDDELKAFYETNSSKEQMFQTAPFMKSSKNKDDKVGKKEYAPFEEVRDDVKKVLLQQKLGEVYQRTIETLKVQYGLTIEEECLKKFVVRSEPAAVGEPSTPAVAPAAQSLNGSRISQTA